MQDCKGQMETLHVAYSVVCNDMELCIYRYRGFAEYAGCVLSKISRRKHVSGSVRTKLEHQDNSLDLNNV